MSGSNVLDGPSPSGYQQYIRAASLKIGKADDPTDALDLTDFRFTFSVTRDSVSTPNVIRLQIYNLSDATANKIRKEYTRVFLQAGYIGSFGTIFDGTITQMMRGASGTDERDYLGPGEVPVFSRRENPTDTFLDIVALDGDLLYNFATIHITLAAGATPNNQLDAIRRVLQSRGGDLKIYGDTGSLSDQKAPRAQTMHGQVRRYLDGFCASHGYSWSIQDNVVELVPNNNYVSSNLVVLSPATGLIGMPRQTINGIEFTALLNPYLRVNRAVQLDNGAIQQSQPPVGYAQIDLTQPLNGQGLYRILYYQHTGDSRGNSWYTHVIAIGINQAGPAPGTGVVNYFA